MNLEDLGKSVSELSDGELMDLLKDIRASRRVRKVDGQASPKKSTPAVTSTPGAIIASASPDLINALIAKIEGSKKSGA